MIDDLLYLAPVAACAAHHCGADSAGRQQVLLTLNIHDLHRGFLIYFLLNATSGLAINILRKTVQGLDNGPNLFWCYIDKMLRHLALS